jgi:hypothetical protein
MVIIITLAFLLLVFFCVKKHTGPAHLAMIAGLSVYELFGRQFAESVHNLAEGSDLHLIEVIIYVALILIFPLLLYFRSARGGLHGLLRLAEAVIFAALLTSLLAASLAEFLPFDTLARDLAAFIKDIEGYIIIIGILSAYLDILLYHSPDE